MKVRKNVFSGYNINPVVSVNFDVGGRGGVLLSLFLSLHLFPPSALPMEEKYQQKGKTEMHGITNIPGGSQCFILGSGYVKINV